MIRISTPLTLLALFLVAIFYTAGGGPVMGQTNIVTLAPTSFTNSTGGSGFGQTVANLHVQDQSGSQDDFDNYIEFLTPNVSYSGYREYVVPSTVSPASITALQVKANFKGPEPADQTWTWSLYDWAAGTWAPIGANAGTSWDGWTLLTFDADGPPGRFVEPTTRQIRVQLESDNADDDCDIDYEAVLLTIGTTPTATPTSTPVTTGTNYYVATTGDDASDGSIETPWRTIQKAANTARAGSTVYVRGGIYNEAVTINVSGSAASGPTTFSSYPDESAVLDGTGLVVPDDYAALFLIDSQSYLVIRDFEFRNYRTATAGRVPMGIFVFGGSNHIELRNNVIHHIETNFTGTTGGDAHGIAVYGTSGTQSINNLIIDGNELHSLKLGSSEALVINGNVEQFEVTNNSVHDANNIGIDVIGFENQASANDQARNGLIRGNLVYNISSYGNPAYGNEYSAGGIYVDGGRDVIIERNRVHHADFGIELASENPGRATSNIIVRNNFVYLNNSAGLAIGGYDTGRGSTENCTIVNNTLFRNNRKNEGTGELYVQFYTRNNVIKNNIFFAAGSEALIWNDYAQNSGNDVDYNFYFASGGSTASHWRWKETDYTGFAAYQAGTGNDAHSLFLDPQFVDTVVPDLHLQATSSAINQGDSSVNAGTQDFDGGGRRQGVIDIGADEAPRPKTESSTQLFLPIVVNPTASQE